MLGRVLAPEPQQAPLVLVRVREQVLVLGRELVQLPAPELVQELVVQPQQELVALPEQPPALGCCPLVAVPQVPH